MTAVSLPQAASDRRGSFAAVGWWIGWIVLTIASFFLSGAVWTPLIAGRFGSMREPGVPILWVVAVFGTWIVLLVPLIIVMYVKVDKAYEDARIRREEAARAGAPAFRWIPVPAERRRLPAGLARKARRFPAVIKRGRLVTAFLSDGRRVENVFVTGGEVLGVYGRSGFDFEIRDIADLEPANLKKLPAFKPGEWLRLDAGGG